MSELAATVITSFNDFMFGTIKRVLNPPPQNEIKRVNFDLIHLTFIIKEVEEYNQRAGKVIVTLPLSLLHPEVVTSSGEKFNETNFPNTDTYAKVFVGKTKFSLYDLKHLENDDVVVFENSDIEKLTLTINGQDLAVSLNPNMDLLIPEDNDGGEIMSNIVNDRYGVKINNVIADSGEAPMPRASRQAEAEVPQQEERVQYQEEAPQVQESYSGSDDEEFDYSDFELEDENI